MVHKDCVIRSTFTALSCQGCSYYSLAVACKGFPQVLPCDFHSILISTWYEVSNDYSSIMIVAKQPHHGYSEILWETTSKRIQSRCGSAREDVDPAVGQQGKTLTQLWVSKGRHWPSCGSVSEDSDSFIFVSPNIHSPIYTIKTLALYIQC